METKELISKIENVIREAVPSQTIINVWHYKIFGEHIGIRFYPESKPINGVSGQYPQVVSLSLDLKTFELIPQAFSFNGGRVIYRKPNMDDPNEKYLAMKRVKIPFRKPKPEEKHILAAVKRFAENWVLALKENVDVLTHQDYVNYKEFLDS